MTSLADQPADVISLLANPLQPESVCSLAETCATVRQNLAGTTAELRRAHYRRRATTQPSPLAALVAKVDEERATSATDDDMKARHKALVRAAGRQALEDTLRTGSGDEESKLATMTLESLTAEWAAYAEVFGTNGMAAGGGRSAAVLDASDTSGSSSPGPSWRIRSVSVVAVAVCVVGLLVVRQTRLGRA
tara:strand:- start:1092 stop:1664 length:573 start_codon:yes stop_codon:yes gene_type:complete